MRISANSSGSAPYDLEHGKNCIRLPPELSLPPSARTSLELVRFVYDDVIAENLQQLALRAVLTPRNLNEAVLAGFLAESIHILPCATTIQGGTREDYATYPVDYLNSLDLPGLPLAALRLCRGAIVVLLWNVDYEGGLCNGTRALIINISPRVLDVLLLSGRCAGQRTFLPRIPMSPSDYVLPVKLELSCLMRCVFEIQGQRQAEICFSAISLEMLLNCSQGCR